MSGLNKEGLGHTLPSPGSVSWFLSDRLPSVSFLLPNRMGLLTYYTIIFILLTFYINNLFNQFILESSEISI